MAGVYQVGKSSYVGRAQAMGLDDDKRQRDPMVGQR